jgi:hypothetical protein
VLHDTTTFADRGETEGHPGLWPAVEQFLKLGLFRVKARYTNNNGLTVLEAVTAWPGRGVVAGRVRGRTAPWVSCAGC